MNLEEAEQQEWLETDGMGGFASGTVSLMRTRRYHGLLLVAAQPPSDRMMLVSGIEAWIETEKGRHWISSQRYEDGAIYPDGADRIRAFRVDPWPSWTFDIPNCGALEFELFLPYRTGSCVMIWRAQKWAGGGSLFVRPLLAGRFFHRLVRDPECPPHLRSDLTLGSVEWFGAEDVPSVQARASGVYTHDPVQYRAFRYERERERGLDFEEDLCSPGVFELDLENPEVALWFTAEVPGYRPHKPKAGASLVEEVKRVRADEHSRRMSLGDSLERRADAYLVQGRRGRTVIAGYPWFGDWGRDTFIALRGLCIATGRLGPAAEVLSSWSDAVSEGMLPNRFPDRGEQPEYNSVDASLWYVVAASELLDAMAAAGTTPPALESKLRDAAFAIVEGFMRGTRHGIRVDDDGLVAAGEPGVQLTWMDAKVGDRVITPRIGKPVEIQALWFNALRFIMRSDSSYETLLQRGLQSFEQRFFDEELGYLVDVVDENHTEGRVNRQLRPNQLFAIGGLPFQTLHGSRAEQVVSVVEQRLWTPMGPRSLDPDDPDYVATYEGGPVERDSAYHQGTVWPWLIGPFIEAWVRTHGNDRQAKKTARSKFLEPLLKHRAEAGLGHVSEIADADPPHSPKGAPFQAWSVGEVLRMARWLNGSLGQRL